MSLDIDSGELVALMNAGKVKQIGSPQDVLDHPASPFVTACAWPRQSTMRRRMPRPLPMCARMTGPIARLELLPLDASTAGGNEIIEAHIPAQLFHELGLQTNDTRC